MMTATQTTRTEVPADAPTVAHARRVDAAPDLAWQAWTQPDLFARWFGPDGFTITMQEMDVRTGGRSRFLMHAPDGTVYPNRMIYRAVETAKRLDYLHGGDIDNDPSAFAVEVTFTPDGDGTLIRMQSRFPTMEAREAIKAYNAIELGRQTMEKMAAFIEGRAATREDKE